jgi:hypothetical protein
MIDSLTITCPKTFTQDCVNAFDKYLHWSDVNLNAIKIFIHNNNVSVKSLDM